jgi:hypothetical protein
MKRVSADRTACSAKDFSSPKNQWNIFPYAIA